MERISSILFPISLTLMGAGLLMIPLLPMMQQRRTARRLADTLQPLWETLLAQHPEVRLPGRGLPMSQRLTPRITAQRQLIEISDALEEHWVPAVSTLETLALALRDPQSPQCLHNAKDVLVTLDDAPWPEPVLHLSDAVYQTRERSHAR
jgi:hypothetical protein